MNGNGSDGKPWITYHKVWNILYITQFPLWRTKTSLLFHQIIAAALQHSLTAYYWKKLAYTMHWASNPIQTNWVRERNELIIYYCIWVSTFCGYSKEVNLKLITLKTFKMLQNIFQIIAILLNFLFNNNNKNPGKKAMIFTKILSSRATFNQRFCKSSFKKLRLKAYSQKWAHSLPAASTLTHSAGARCHIWYVLISPASVRTTCWAEQLENDLSDWKEETGSRSVHKNHNA